MKLILDNQTARARMTSSFLPVMLGSLGPSLFPSVAIGDSYGDAYPSVSPVGSPGDSGYTADPIAKFDLIENENVNADPYIGVVAFHVNGIDTVQISVNGGAWTTVDQMRTNPRTGVHEYAAQIDLSNLGSKTLVDVRAIVTPRTAGQTITLDPINIRLDSVTPTILWCSPTGSDTTGDGSEGNPYRQPGKALQAWQNSDNVAGRCDDVVVYLADGSYEVANAVGPYPSTVNGWATISKAPTATKANVKITSGNGIRTMYTKYKDVTFEQYAIVGRSLVDSTKPDIWVDGVESYNVGASLGTQAHNSATMTNFYVTSSSFHDMGDGPKFAKLIRDTEAYELAEDAFGGARLLLNCTASSVKIVGDSHPDVMEVFDSSESTIVYGFIALNCEAQGFYATDDDSVGTYSDIAVVNMFIAESPGLREWISQIRDPDNANLNLSNIIIDQCTFATQPLFIQAAGTVENVKLSNNVFFRLQLGTTDPNDIVAEHNHFIDTTTAGSTTIGTDQTTGDLVLANLTLDDGSTIPSYTGISDFAVPSGSTLKSRSSSGQSNIDVLKATRTASSSTIGALE